MVIIVDWLAKSRKAARLCRCRGGRHNDRVNTMILRVVDGAFNGADAEASLVPPENGIYLDACPRILKVIRV
jgi:hypothetical protein